MDIRKEIEFFDRVVAEHDDSEVLDDAAYDRFAAIFESIVRPRPGEVCIDLACGTGAFTRCLRRSGVRLTGIDISPASIARARERSAGETYVVGDIRATGLPDGSADIVAYSGVLHHCSTHADRLAALAEGSRILGPGGRLFAYDPNSGSPAMILYRHPRSPLYCGAGRTPNEVLLDRGELRRELEATGFVDIRLRGVSGTPFRYVEGRIARWLLPLYNRVYEPLLRSSPLEDRFGTFLVTAARRPESTRA